MEYIKNIVRHRHALAIALGSVVALIVALLVFQAGVFVGYSKASFSYRGGERFVRMIEGPLPGFADGDDVPPSHGTVGKVVSVSLPSFIVASPDNTERTVVVSGQTSIRIFKSAATTTDIRTNQYVLVLGEPDQSGVIRARFIRLLPAPEEGAASSTQTSAH